MYSDGISISHHVQLLAKTKQKLAITNRFASLGLFNNCKLQ